MVLKPFLSPPLETENPEKRPQFPSKMQYPKFPGTTWQGILYCFTSLRSEGTCQIHKTYCVLTDADPGPMPHTTHSQAMEVIKENLVTFSSHPHESKCPRKSMSKQMCIQIVIDTVKEKTRTWVTVQFCHWLKSRFLEETFKPRREGSRKVSAMWEQEQHSGEGLAWEEV